MANNDRTRGRRVRRAAGCIVYRNEGNGIAILLIRDPYGRWTLPKGHLEDNEDDRQAAVREVLEETGVTGELGPLVSTITYSFLSRNRLVEKHVAFFLMRTTTTQITPQLSEGISDAAWVPLETTAQRIDYDQVRGVIEQAMPILQGLTMGDRAS